MINKFKQFENKSNMRYVVIDIESGIIESVVFFDDKESAYNWVRNFVYENFESMECLEDLDGVTDPYELLQEFNTRWAPDLEMYLHNAVVEPPVKLNKSIELRMTTKKYNI